MVCETCTYEDYDGNMITENLYFHFSRAEIIEMENSIPGGMAELFKRLVNTVDKPGMMKAFKELVLKSYGIKSDDGKRFRKSEEISKAFEESPAYDQFLIKLLTEEGAAEKFLKGIIPKVEETNSIPAPKM